MDIANHEGMRRINKALPWGHELADFRNFLYLVWEFLGLPEPTPVQYDMAYHVQLNALNGASDRKAIYELPRGIGKSFICATYAVWRLLLNPDEKILVCSGNEERAKDFTSFCKRLILGMEILQHLRGGSRNSSLSFDVAGASTAQSPSMKAAGIMGSIVGSRATIIIGDDTETPNSVETQGSRDKLDARVKEFGDIITPETQEIIFLGTPQGEESVYNKLNARGYRLHIWTAKKISPETNDKYYNGNVMPFCVTYDEKELEQATEPTRFSTEVLDRKEVEHGKTRFQQQYMLLPHLLDKDKFPLKLRDLIVTDLDAERSHQFYVWCTRLDKECKDIPNVGFAGDRYYEPLESGGSLQNYTGSIMMIDPSGRGGDETGYAVTKMLNGYVFVMEAGGIAGGYGDEVLEKLVCIASKHAVNEIIIEANFGDGMFMRLLQPVAQRIYPVKLSEVRAQTNKEIRICDILEPLMNSHKLVINKSLIKDDYDSVQKYSGETSINYSLMYQISHMTRQKGCLRNDDRIDALASACAYWVDAVSQDAEVAMRLRKEELWREEIANFKTGVLGGKKKSLKFF